MGDLPCIRVGFGILEIEFGFGPEIQLLATFGEVRRINILFGDMFAIEPWNINLINFEADLVAFMDDKIMLLMIYLELTLEGFLVIPHIG